MDYSVLISEFNNQLTPDLFCHKLSLVLNLISIQTLNHLQLSKLWHDILDCILPNKNMFDKSIDLKNLLTMTQHAVTNFTLFMNQISNHKISIPLTDSIQPFLIILHSVPLFEQLSDVNNFENSFKTLFNCNELGDCLNKTVLKSTVDILKSRNANNNEEWTLVYGNTIIWKHLIFHIK